MRCQVGVPATRQGVSSPPRRAARRTYRQQLGLPLQGAPRPPPPRSLPRSTDLLPPPAAIAAWRRLAQPSSATTAHDPRVRSAGRGRLAQEAFRRGVDPEWRCAVVGSGGTAHLPLAVLNPGESPCARSYYPSHLAWGLQLASGRSPAACPPQCRSEAGWRPTSAVPSQQPVDSN